MNKLLDKFEDFILTELETDYIMRAFLLIISVYIINLALFGNSIIGTWIVLGLFSLYGLYVTLIVITILRSAYKSHKKGDN